MINTGFKIESSIFVTDKNAALMFLKTVCLKEKIVF